MEQNKIPLYKIKYYCKDCNKKINYKTALYRGGRCKSCGHIKLYKNPQNHPNYKDGRTLKQYYCKVCGKKLNKSAYISKYKRCRKCSNIIMAKIRTIWQKHHLYLRKFKIDKIIIIKNSVHQKFHSKVYEYLLETQGKKSIRKYLKWFTNKYGLEQKRRTNNEYRRTCKT